MIWFLICISALYFGILLFLTIGFVKFKEYELSGTRAKNGFSVVIPFRNEAKNLPTLLASIQQLRYPKEAVEFLFVDDASSDASSNIIHTYLEINSAKNIKVIDNRRASNSPKKDAISTAICHSKNDWIITTDADCILPENWLTTFNDFILQHNPQMVVAPVNYQTKSTFLEHFQLLDFMSMQGVTIGSFGVDIPLMCNGANLAYNKNKFMLLGGFQDNNHMASGDDVFLFEKFLIDNKKNVQFLKSKEAIVTTYPVSGWRKLIDQRTRWAAKTSAFKFVEIQLVGVLVLLTNFAIVFSFFLTVFGLFSVKYVILFFVLKLGIDLFLLVPSLRFFGYDKKSLKYYFFSGVLYPFFSVFIVFKSIFYTYTWKERIFKK